MKENEFDIYLKSVFEDAQESVSPEVWDGVVKGLERKRRARIIPFYVFGITAAAAAAITLGVFLFKDSPATNNTVIDGGRAVAESVTAPETLPGEDEADIPALEEQIAASPSAAAQSRIAMAEPAVEVPGEPVRTIETEGVQSTSATQAKTVPSEAVSSEVAPVEAAPAQDFSSDSRMLDQLARESEARRPSSFLGRISIGASGNIQNNNRKEIPQNAILRTPPAPVGPGLPTPPLSAGISNEQPEVHFSMPVSAGLSVRVGVLPRLSLGTGVLYTGMSRTFVADFSDTEHGEIYATDMDNSQSWIGVPLNIYFNILETPRWQVYAHAGGTAEWLLSNIFLIHHAPNDIVYDGVKGHTQFSAGGGVGVMFGLTRHVGLFLDPSLRYYFNTENQPRSIRTIQPLRFDMEAGLRFFFD